ncbi:MAG: nuclear transport factor 2 family protein [Candidatus Acidiferrales bacterium]
MTKVRIGIVAMLLMVPALAKAQEAKKMSLQDTLFDVDQKWLCSGPYQMPFKECVKSRSEYWVPGFFEVQSSGTFRNKEEMVAQQSAADQEHIVRPYPADFKFVAQYGDVAIGTDHTDFKTIQPDQSFKFTADSHCLRVLVKYNGEWRPAAAGLVPVIPPSEAATKNTGATTTRTPDAKLEKELAAFDQKWLEAVRTGNVKYIDQIYTDKWAEILGWDPTSVLFKEDAMKRIPKLNFKPGEGLFADQFKLMSVYGNVALASDRRVRKMRDAGGNLTSTDYRTVLVFVKEGGQWKVAADALIPIMGAK